MISGDTIAALASGPGWADRAILRVSGARVRSLEQSLLRGLAPCAPMPAANAPITFAASLSLGDRLELPVLAVAWSAPRSYTGEDALELYLPGNPHLARRTLDAILAFPGLRPARPGEFTERAYWNDRLSLEQAEGLAAILAARSRRDLDAARRIMSGAAGTQAHAIADDVSALLALVEAGIDFSDQDGVSAIAPESLRARLHAAIAGVDSLLAGPASREDPGLLPRVALAGAPNAGKSSLFNALLGRARAAASPRPGTTRDAIAEPLEVSPGSWITLVDLPGLEIESPSDEIEAIAQRNAREILASSDLILVCDPDARFDAPVPPGTPRLDVRTKADLHGQPSATLSVSVSWPASLGPLRDAIAGAIDRAVAADDEPVLTRHRDALARARRELEAALERASSPRAPGELIALSLRSALDAIGTITGRVHPDELIGLIFRKFCVGK